jgi:hypothetical protein
VFSALSLEFMNIEKHKLPTGYSFALKTSMLEKALIDNNIIIDTQLICSKSEIFFDAHYWLPNQNVDYPRFYIRVGHVKSNRRKDALKYMHEVVITEFIKWAKEIISLPEQSTKLTSENYFRKNFT